MVCLAKNSGVQRRVVFSHSVALAPFSQNSKVCGCAGLVQAQDTHMKPPGLFCRLNVSSAAGVGRSRASTSAMPRTEPQPPAAPP